MNKTKPLSLSRVSSAPTAIKISFVQETPPSYLYLLIAAEGAFSASSGGKTLSRTTKPTVPLGQPVRMPAKKRRGEDEDL